MYDYDDDRNQVRINLINLKNAIDSEKQDTDRLIIDLKAELREKSVEIESLEKEINNIVEERTHYRIISDGMGMDLVALITCIMVGCIVSFMLGSWDVIR